jgi:hypothetical protein
MEVIIASIGGLCTLLSSIGSIYVDRKYNRDSVDEIKEDNIRYHSIISNINFWIKNEIPHTDYKYDYIKTFLIFRLTIIKNNVKKFLEIDTKNVEYDYLIMKLSDLLNGENEYQDLQIGKEYPEIPIDFVKKFNKWDNRSELILMYYLKSIKFSSNYQLIYHFLNVYTAALNAMINSLLSNLDILVNEPINKGVIIRDRYKKIFSDFHVKTNMDTMIKNVISNDKEYENFLFRFNDRGIITYCTESVNILHYNLENLIGSHVMTLVSQDHIHEIINFITDKKKILHVKIHGKDDKYHKVVIKQLSSDSKLNLCFLV